MYDGYFLQRKLRLAGYKATRIERLMEDVNPPLALLTDWVVSNGNTAMAVDLLTMYLEQLGRLDIVQVIQRAKGETDFLHHTAAESKSSWSFVVVFVAKVTRQFHFIFQLCRNYVGTHKLMGPVCCSVMSIHTNLWAHFCHVASVHTDLWAQFCHVTSVHTDLWAQSCCVGTHELVGPVHSPVMSVLILMGPVLPQTCGHSALFCQSIHTNL